jgi:hypothetical protein
MNANIKLRLSVFVIISLLIITSKAFARDNDKVIIGEEVRNYGFGNGLFIQETRRTEKYGKREEGFMTKFDSGWRQTGGNTTWEQLESRRGSKTAVRKISYRDPETGEIITKTKTGPARAIKTAPESPIKRRRSNITTDMVRRLINITLVEDAKERERQMREFLSKYSDYNK